MKKLIFILVVFAGLFYQQLSSQGIGINNTGDNAHSSAILDVSSTDKGFLLPRMTTAQRDAIASPAEGLHIFNTTTKCLQFFVNGTWQDVKCATCPTLASAPTTATNIPSATQIVWNWNGVVGASGYKWNTTNNYAAATDLGNTTTVTQTGLACGTSYTIYVWAYNSCGNNSPALTLTQSTSACPFICGTSSVTFTYKGSSVTYGTVLGVNSRCWLDRNLGATQVATSSTDVNSYGDLFQWGRGDDGHQNRTSATTSTLSNTDNPGNALFITLPGPSTPSDWRNPQNNNLWQGVNGINNPCPSGWRVPTYPELDAERQSWVPNNDAGAFASTLKLSTAGIRYFFNGGIETAAIGYYWSSTTINDRSSSLLFGSNGAGLDDQNRANGMSVRCIKD